SLLHRIHGPPRPCYEATGARAMSLSLLTDARPGAPTSSWRRQAHEAFRVTLWRSPRRWVLMRTVDWSGTIRTVRTFRTFRTVRRQVCTKEHCVAVHRWEVGSSSVGADLRLIQPGHRRDTRGGGRRRARRRRARRERRGGGIPGLVQDHGL